MPRAHIRRAALTLGAAALLSTGSAEAATVVATEVGTATVTALEDRAVWSEPVPGGDGRYRLYQAIDGGPAKPVPGVRTRRGPFDADLGVDRAHRPVVTYSRCRRGRPSTPNGEMPLARFDRAAGCQIFQHRLGQRGEAPLLERGGPVSHYKPSRWGELLAYAALDTRRRGDPSAVRVVVRDLRTSQAWRFYGTRHSRLPRWQPGGPGPLAIDLREGRLAYAWAETLLLCPTPATDPFIQIHTEIRTADARGGKSARIAEECSGPSVFNSVLGVAVLDDGTIAYGHNQAPPLHRGPRSTVMAVEANGGDPTPISERLPFLSSIAVGEESLFATISSRRSDVLRFPRTAAR